MMRFYLYRKLLIVLPIFLWAFDATSQINDYLSSGREQIQKKKYVEAISDFSEAIRLDATSGQAYFGRSVAYTYTQNFQKALSDINAALSIDKNRAEYFAQRAKVFFELKQYEKAVQDISQAIFMQPENALFYHQRALVRLALQDYEGCNQDVEKSLQINQELVEPYAEQGLALFQLGFKQEAEKCFEKFLQKNDLGSYYLLVEYIVAFGNKNPLLLQKAENWALKTVQIQDNYKSNYLYAQVLDLQDKKLNALDVCQKAISLAKKENVDFSEAERLLDKINQGNIDDIPPVISLVSPAVMRGGILVGRQNEVSIIGKATDESGVKEVFINGNPARLFPNGDFNGITLLKDAQALVIEATDYKGNTEKVTFQVIRPNEYPHTEKRFKSLGKSYALIFATNQYEYWNNLSNPIPDAQAVAQDLQEIYGYEIDLVQNPTQNQIILKLKEYLRKRFQPNDQLLIFFAGHGQYDETFGEGYVVAKDSRLDDEARSSYLSYATLRTYINNIQAKHILLVMDVCFGGTFDPQLASKNLRGTPSSQPKDDEIEDFINRKMQARTRRYITSGGKEYVSDGTPGMHSPFVRKFLEALRSYGGKDKIMTIAEILTYLETIMPQPHHGEFGSNEPGSDFLMISR